MQRTVRVAWGLTLLVRPDAVLAAAGAPPDARAEAVGRVLGARHLLQAAAVGPGAPRLLRRLAAVADVLHVGTCLLAAVALPGWRRAAIADGTVESLLAGLSVSASRHDGAPGHNL